MRRRVKELLASSPTFPEGQELFADRQNDACYYLNQLVDEVQAFLRELGKQYHKSESFAQLVEILHNSLSGTRYCVQLTDAPEKTEAA